MTKKQATETLSVKQIAERAFASREDDVDARTIEKSIRAYLRKHHSRSAELKNSRWGDAKKNYALSAQLTDELVTKFVKSA